MECKKAQKEGNVMENLRVLKNESLNGVELYFDNKPNQNVINDLKSNGFRWHNVKKCWYNKVSEAVTKLIETLSSGIVIENAEPTVKAIRTRAEILAYYGYVENNEGYMGGHFIEGSNHRNLEPREISNRIRKDFAELHPTLKISVSYKSYSGGSSREVTLIGEPEQLFKPYEEFDFNNYYYDFVYNGECYCNRFNNDGFKKVEDLTQEQQEQIKKIFYNNHITTCHQQAKEETYYTEEANQAISDLWIMLKSFAYVESNSMVDYYNGFDVPCVDVASTKAIERDQDLHKLGFREFSKLYPNVDTQIKNRLGNNFPCRLILINDLVGIKGQICLIGGIREMSYKEIFKLKGMLEEAKIPFTFDDKTFVRLEGYQIRLNEKIDVVEHFGSYGESQDLLEIMGALTTEELQNDEVLGYLTADEVFKRFKYCYEHNTYIYREE